MSPHTNPPIHVRTCTPADFPQIIDLCRHVYPDAQPYSEPMLASQRDHFPRGQIVAADGFEGRIIGMCASLIVNWDDYDLSDDWRDFTDGGMFTNHDPAGKTLYAAEVMVDPDQQGRGIGKALYKARRDLCRDLGLKRIRAGARLRGYRNYCDRMSADEYIKHVIAGDIGDPTLSFQLKQGFRVIGVAPDYLMNDPSSQGCAAVIEWVNHKVADRKDYKDRDPEYGKPRKKPE